MAMKRKIDTEIDELHLCVDKVDDIKYVRAQEARDNREFHKIPGLKREFDDAMGRSGKMTPLRLLVSVDVMLTGGFLFSLSHCLQVDRSLPCL